MGDSVAEGTVLEWRKKVGDPVAVDEPLVEISTDKVDAEMPSPVAGTIAEILVAGRRDRPRGHGALPDRGRARAPRRRRRRPPRRRGRAEHARPPPRPATAPSNATPVAARMASAHGIDVERHHAAAARAGA